jgi:2'-5' RNA ligase
MKRLFTALKIQPGKEFTDSFRQLRLGLRNEQIKWVEDHNIHITLKFFGETGEDQIPGICTVLKKCASDTSAITLRLAGLGIFGSAYAPKVVWAGIEPYSELVSLMKRVHNDLRDLGFEPDRQNLVPHLTLGRIRSLNDKITFNRVTGQFKNISSSGMQIGEMILYESILRREGPEYFVLEKFPFIK